MTFLAEYDLARQRQMLEREQAERDELARFEAERAKLVYTTEEIVLPTAPTLSSRRSSASSPSSSPSASPSSSSSTSSSSRPPVTQKKKAGLLGVSVIQVASKRKQADLPKPAGEKHESDTKTTNKKPKHEKDNQTDENSSGDEGEGLKLVDY